MIEQAQHMDMLETHTLTHRHTLSCGAGWKVNSGVLLKEADS